MIESYYLCISTHTAPTRGFGGPSVSFRNFINFIANDINYYLITTCPYKFKFIKKLRSRELFLPTLILHGFGLSILACIFILIKSRSANGIIINGVTTFVNVTGLVAALVNKRIRLVVFSRGSFENGRTDNWNFFKKLWFKFNILLINKLNDQNRIFIVYQTQTEKIKSEVTSLLPSCVYGNINTISYKSYALNEDHNRDIDICYVGRFSKEKGVDRLLRLLKQLVILKSKLSIVLIFDGISVLEIGQVEIYTKSLNCVILQNCDNAEVLKFFANSKVIYFPSYIENYGNTLVEAASRFAMPVVYGDTHWSDLLKNGIAISENELYTFISDGFIKYDHIRAIKFNDYVFDRYISGNDYRQVTEWLK